ncbi:hypothetical protein NQ317_011407 [Molorchus minor]|uniref:Uncharacterized protein n=1 Tax=Molorchus minor TaxID=1323400 RepID=A0ABQ9J356_9CUCU|nr:hypothetical protein NQ317_011407 [Molorchus minor]
MRSFGKISEKFKHLRGTVLLQLCDSDFFVTTVGLRKLWGVTLSDKIRKLKILKITIKQYSSDVYFDEDYDEFLGNRWIRTTRTFWKKAPFHDLQFCKELIKYKTINASISKAACGKIKNHLWYLNPENVSLSFFDKNILIDDKKEMSLMNDFAKKAGPNGSVICSGCQGQSCTNLEINCSSMGSDNAKLMFNMR